MKVFTAFFAASLVAAAQAPDSVPPVPVDQEPHHKVVVKNEFTRVLDAQLPPGYVTLNHRHDVYNVSVTIANGRDGEEGQRGIGRAGFAKGGYSHSVTNRYPNVMRFIVVEVFKSDRPGQAPSDLPNHALETENDHVRIYRLKLAPGESLASHVHSAGFLGVITHGGPAAPGTARWHGAGENIAVQASATESMEVVEIEPK
jgi:hypothetical protein